LTCIRDLAAALRVERERVAEMRGTRKNLEDWKYMLLERETKLLARVAELEAEKRQNESALHNQWVRDGKTIERGALQRNSALARVAELEEDAKLGRMLREMPPRVMEMLADFAHHIWATWTWYMLSHNDAGHQERWRRQASAKYAELSDGEKESDRDVVRKWGAALEAAQKGEP
jgi:hypothetical protein